jgi:heme-degrading monooxygenase HmoA
MITHDARWSLSRGKNPVPSPWQATSGVERSGRRMLPHMRRMCSGLESKATGTPGNRGAWLLRRIEGDRAEFITVSFWESREAIEAFAGQDINTAVFYPDDDQFLIERDLTVNHYEVAGTE